MPELLTVSVDEIIHQIKLSCQFPSLAEGILTRKIIASTAEEFGIKVEPEELQQAADSLRLMNKLTSADATWSWLKKYNLSVDEFEELVYSTVISSKLAQHMFAQKVEPFYVEHYLNYAQVVMYEVVLDDFDLAMELFYALAEGEINFHEIAHQYIQDAELRRKGGYRGILHRAQLRPEISSAVFAATPPQIIKPILTSIGVHLILVEELIEPRLDEMLRLKILSDLFSQWLQGRIDLVEIATNLA
ncbi:peptidylprolyl isomerase [Nostoc sp. FACHB-152]|uniref:peptidylprolyl isomerase n=1 Tax=unclassified Nostoc TaxID=2593658 RepID=UPI0016855B5C|nr:MULTISPECIES: peptidylprolyl isomerase [unclassified Nostoc]MBD2451462.1 peptidylprolyl isomerase [Nostoc sp. FACHB-152]MBD2472503.1 peptidylprolyl isomerase [Nostoc sp. FACHB-145]